MEMNDYLQRDESSDTKYKGHVEFFFFKNGSSGRDLSLHFFPLKGLKLLSIMY